eukprot:TRINITY_DN4887_c0_g2_i4.p1 TRINITY_DN4887_c0_g2~~TRINITY_DN4887_c0_g2_i4.p1  ORF type:complete len:335 (+),score=81.98 TRINITY_DN4887_c0_g2_i4:64-1068(+)
MCIRDRVSTQSTWGIYHINLMAEVEQLDESSVEQKSRGTTEGRRKSGNDDSYGEISMDRGAEDEEESKVAPKKQKKKRPAGEPSAMLHKRKRGGADNGEDLDERAVEDETIEDRAEELVREMEAALRKDGECLRDGRAALNRMKLMPRLEKELRSSSLQEFFMKSNGMDVIAAWLQKLPDGSSPSKPIVQAMLGILSNFELWDELQSSDVTRALSEIKASVGRDVAFEKQIQSLLDKWNRFGVEPEQRRITKKVNLATNNSARLTLRSEDDVRRTSNSGQRKLYLPERSLLDFSRAPQSKDVRDRREENDDFRKNMRKATMQLARTMRKDTGKR